MNENEMMKQPAWNDMLRKAEQIIYAGCFFVWNAANYCSLLNHVLA